MPAYHTVFNDGEYKILGNMAVLPLKGKIKGPAPTMSDSEAEDIIDEALALYRANCFFRNFEIKGNGDRVLIYLTLFIQECLLKLTKNPPAAEAAKILNTHALQNFAIPGDGNFPLNAVYIPPRDRTEMDVMKNYISQLRQECASRITSVVYDKVENKPSKWWMCFSKRKFMGIGGITGFTN